MTDFQVAVFLADLALIVLLARVIGLVARYFGLPAVIGEILAGIIVGPTLLHGVIGGTLFPLNVRPFLGALADLGLVLFMFATGLEFDFRRLRGSGRVAGGTAIGSTLLPFGLGLLLALYLARSYHPAHQLPFVLFIGVAVSVSAFPVLARILTDQGMHRTRLGTIALSAAAVCDLAAWTMLAVVQAIAGHSTQSHWLILLLIPYAALLIMVVRPLLTRWLTRSGPGGPVPGSKLMVLLTGMLVSAAVTQLVGLHFVFGAFLFGLVMPRLDDIGCRAEVLRRLQFAIALLLPVYFIVAGLNVDLSKIGTSGVLQLGLIMVVAITGKFAGTWLGARSQGLAARDSAVLGTLMNTRGLTELVALTIGLQIGVLDKKLFSLMVVMAVITTAMTAPILRLLMGHTKPAEPAWDQDESHIPPVSVTAGLPAGGDPGPAVIGTEAEQAHGD